jgi:hypothetical protein
LFIVTWLLFPEEVEFRTIITSNNFTVFFLKSDECINRSDNFIIFFLLKVKDLFFNFSCLIILVIHYEHAALFQELYHNGIVISENDISDLDFIYINIILRVIMILLIIDGTNDTLSSLFLILGLNILKLCVKNILNLALQVFFESLNFRLIRCIMGKFFSEIGKHLLSDFQLDSVIAWSYREHIPF